MWSVALDCADVYYSKRIARLCCRGFASAEATRGLSDRPLDPFGSPLPYFWGIVFYEPEVHWINTRAQHGSALDSIAQKGQGRNSLAGCRDSVPAGVKGQSPLGFPHKHADTVCKCAQPNRAKGSRDEVPCRVQGQRPCWGQGAKPLAPPLPSHIPCPLLPRLVRVHGFVRALHDVTDR